MDAILNNLKDPSWWFSAFFIAIIASVIAGFLKDRTEKWLSTIFSGLSAWRAQREETRAKLIDAILADQMYFHVALFRTVIGMILFVICSIGYFSAPVLLATIPEQSNQLLPIDSKFLVWKVFTPILGVLTLFVSYCTSRSVSIVSQAMREYRKRNNLPKLF